MTIDGVTCVIDSGLARIARHSPWSGIPSLEIEPVSRASCAQRAGRAGRTRPGRVVRLYTKHDHDLRRPFEVPEIGRADLGGRRARAPRCRRRRARRAALVRAPADPRGHGRRNAARTTRRDPRRHDHRARAPDPTVSGASARRAHGVRSRDPRRRARGVRDRRAARRTRAADGDGAGPAHLPGRADLVARRIWIDDLDVVVLDGCARCKRAACARIGCAAKRHRHRSHRGTLSIRCSGASLDRLVDLRDTTPCAARRCRGDRELQQAILGAYPDRVGKRRAPGSSEIVFAGGGSGTLAPSSAVIEPELLVAVDVAKTGARGGRPRRSRSGGRAAIDPSWLLDLYLDRVDEGRDEPRMERGAPERVERRHRR